MADALMLAGHGSVQTCAGRKISGDRGMTNFSIDMLGVILVVAALAYAAYLRGAAPMWIGIGVLLLLGTGLIGAANKAGMKQGGGQAPRR